MTDINYARLLRVTWSRASEPAIESDVWQLGLIVYELVTNAARHAFNGRAGKIVIELECTDGLARCKVTGNAFASSNVRSGQGPEVIRQSANDLGGTVQLRLDRKDRRQCWSFL